MPPGWVVSTCDCTKGISLRVCSWLRTDQVIWLGFTSGGFVLLACESSLVVLAAAQSWKHYLLLLILLQLKILVSGNPWKRTWKRARANASLRLGNLKCQAVYSELKTVLIQRLGCLVRSVTGETAVLHTTTIFLTKHLYTGCSNLYIGSSNRAIHHTDTSVAIFVPQSISARCLKEICECGD